MKNYSNLIYISTVPPPLEKKKGNVPRSQSQSALHVVKRITVSNHTSLCVVQHSISLRTVPEIVGLPDCTVDVCGHDLRCCLTIVKASVIQSGNSLMKNVHYNQACSNKKVQVKDFVFI